MQYNLHVWAAQTSSFIWSNSQKYAVMCRQITNMSYMSDKCRNIRFADFAASVRCERIVA